MQYVGKVISSVSGFYKELNPATLTGAIDIVVVKDSNDEMQCSPWHVRFGKLQLLRPSDKVVELIVNDKESDIHMKVDETGEAFFVLETDNPVPSDIATSPIASPLTSPDTSPEPSIRGDTEPDYLDLGSQTRSNKDIIKADGYYSLSSDQEPEDDDDDDHDALEIGGKMSSDYLASNNGVFPALSMPQGGRVGSRGSRSQSFSAPSYTSSSPLKRSIRSNDLTKHQPFRRVRSSGSLGDIAEADAEKEMDQIPEEDMLVSKWIRRLPTDGHRPMSVVSDSEYIYTKEAENTRLVDDDDDLNKVHSGWDWGAQVSISRTQTRQLDGEEEESIESTESDKVTNKSANQSTQVPSASHPKRVVNFKKLSASLCGTEVILEAKTSNKAREAFDKELIPYTTFTSDSLQTLNDPKAVFREGDAYYTWESVAQALLMPLLYGSDAMATPLADFTEEQNELNKRHTEISVLDNDTKKADVVKKRKSSWKWWGKDETDGSSTTTLSPDQKAAASFKHSYAKSDTDIVQTHHDIPSSSDEEVSSLVVSAKKYAKTLRLTPDQLASLDLKMGMNKVVFRVKSNNAYSEARIFLYDTTAQIVISDIDGTITKSDVMGHLFNMVGKDWTHTGVAKLFTDIMNNGYEILYLTARAIGQSDSTREFLRNVNQDGYTLPDGPLLLSPDRLFTSFHREVILKRPQEFKMTCLRQIRNLFENQSPFYAGFGNRITDAMSYRSVNIPVSRICTIDSTGKIKLELLHGYNSSYVEMNDLVDFMFPQLSSKIDPKYNDWEYWKNPINDADIDFDEIARQEEKNLKEKQAQKKLSEKKSASLSKKSPVGLKSMKSGILIPSASTFSAANLPKVTDRKKVYGSGNLGQGLYNLPASAESVGVHAERPSSDYLTNNTIYSDKTQRVGMNSLPAERSAGTNQAPISASNQREEGQYSNDSKTPGASQRSTGSGIEKEYAGNRALERKSTSANLLASFVSRTFSGSDSKQPNITPQIQGQQQYGQQQDSTPEPVEEDMAVYLSPMEQARISMMQKYATMSVSSNTEKQKPLSSRETAPAPPSPSSPKSDGEAFDMTHANDRKDNYQGLGIAGRQIKSFDSSTAKNNSYQPDQHHNPSNLKPTSIQPSSSTPGISNDPNASSEQNEGANNVVDNYGEDDEELGYDSEDDDSDAMSSVSREIDLNAFPYL
ncbi:lipin Ned1 [Mycoemilia scoparia]|uniref:phosphatidate phosphatase n=1 Tax=Mycoemilia scoparia TaxID=417184 RepID=A0A9W7ZSX7_9FUNG|nr:lipin Ned1 [Mycoemilia scoparia]